MNLIEIYVTNIVSVKKIPYEGVLITANFDSWGISEKNATRIIHIKDYISIVHNGYYLG